MAEFDDFDIEVQNEKDSDPEHFTVTVATAGSPVTISPTNTKPIQLLYVKNANKGPNANSPNDVVLVTIDGSANVVSVSRGEYTYFPGVFSSVDIDATADGTKAEIIVWS